MTVVAVVLCCLVPVASAVGEALGMVVAIGVTGLALGPVFPLAVHRAGRSGGTAAAMTARVSAVGYLAYLTGPPMVGFAAESIGLPVAFAAGTVLRGIGIHWARRVSRRHGRCGRASAGRGRRRRRR
ncbi:MFS transporter [Cryptosporangium aurantiacum]|uniref:MFS transporter n=1 Tax=Cryptosporangium aurantiacum TaxID=134849 RepID=UPI0011610300|nr:MFS transporter [Cryptosporangium aurantiacum]